MASAVYTAAKYRMLNDTLHWSSSSTTFVAMLVGSGYTYNSAHRTVADVSGEVVDASYARVGVTGRTVYRDVSGGSAQARAAAVSFPALSGVTPSGCVIYQRVGTDDTTPSDDPLVCFLDFTDIAADGTDFIVEFPALGMFALGTDINFFETVFGEIIVGGIGL